MVGSCGSNMRFSSKEGAASCAAVTREWTFCFVKMSWVGSPAQYV